MGELKQWIESHPYLTGGIFIGAIILYLLYRNSQSTAATSNSATTINGLSPTDYASLQQAQLAAGTQLQAYQLQANSQVSQQNAALQSQAMTDAAATQAAYYTAQNQLQAIVSQQQNTTESTNAGLQLGLAQVLATPGSSISGSQATQTLYGLTQLTAANTTAQTAQQTAIATAVSTPVAPIAPVYNTNPVVTFSNPVIPVQTPAPIYQAASISTPVASQTYQQYINAAVPALNPLDFNTADVMAHVNAITAANQAWISDPNSPHNLPPGCVRQANGLLQCA